MSKDKKKVLVVDDEEMLCQMVKLNLEKTGAYDVEMVHRGSRALEALHNFAPDLILLDLSLPDCVGSAVAYELRQDPAGMDVPIIFWTGLISPHDKPRQLCSIENSTLLSKPVSRDVLLNSIDQVLNGSNVAESS